MKKCKGCGITLQDTNKDAVGYVVDLNQDYCQRCFRLSHYGDTSHLNRSYVSNDIIFKIYDKYSDSLFVVIIDIIDSLCLIDDELLSYFDKYQTVLVFNKTDLLHENITDHKINQIYVNLLLQLKKKHKNTKNAARKRFMKTSFFTKKTLNFSLFFEKIKKYVELYRQKG